MVLFYNINSNTFLAKQIVFVWINIGQKVSHSLTASSLEIFPPKDKLGKLSLTSTLG